MRMLYSSFRTSEKFDDFLEISVEVLNFYTILLFEIKGLRNQGV